MKKIITYPILLMLIGIGLAFNITALAQSDLDRAALAYQDGDYDRAFELWQTLAKSGDAEAQYSLGVMHYKGDGRPRNITKAIYWFRKAAQQDHLLSLFNVGIAFWEGNGVDRDYFLATEWWRRAAEQDLAAAQYNLGIAYYLGRGVQKNIEHANTWLQKAADDGYEPAIDTIALLEQREAAQPTQESGPSLAELGYTPATVDSAAVNVYANRALSDAIITELAPGTPLRIVAQQDNWYHVQAPGGLPVWVFGDFVDSDGRISGDRVRARPMPSTGASSAPIGFLNRGDKVTIIDTRDRWKQVLAPETMAAWVQADGVVAHSSLPANWEQQWRSSMN